MAKEHKASTSPQETPKFRNAIMPSESKEVETTPNKKVEVEGEPVFTGTSAKLFADLAPEPAKELPSKKEDAVKAEAEGPEKKTAEPKIEADDDFLDMESFKDKKIKAKIDGKEREVTLKDLIKGYQTDQYLTQKGQRIAEEAKLLDDLKKIKADFEAKNVPEENEVGETFVKPYLTPIEQELKILKETMATLQPTIGPMVYQNNLKKLDSSLKEEGFDDFMDYVPKIEEHIFSLPPEHQARFDNLGSFMSLYHKMKSKDLIAASKNPPVRKVDERKEPKVVKIESESGSSGADDWSTQYQSAFERAKKSGDWTEVLALKGAV